jgi:hypothetical protein
MVFDTHDEVCCAGSRIPWCQPTEALLPDLVVTISDTVVVVDPLVDLLSTKRGSGARPVQSSNENVLRLYRYRLRRIARDILKGQR